MTRVGSPKTCVFDRFSRKYDRELDRKENAKKEFEKNSELGQRTGFLECQPKISHE